MMQSLDVGFHRILPLLKQVYNSTVEERTFIKSLEKMVRPSMPLLEQASRFKFSLSIDGKAAPWRLALQLPLESTIIRQDGGPFGEFFDDRLKPMEHYIPLNLNLSNIAEQAAWAIANDAAAHNITRNARLAAKEILSLDALVCHTSTVLSVVSQALRLPVDWTPPPEARATLIFDPTKRTITSDPLRGEDVASCAVNASSAKRAREALRDARCTKARGTTVPAENCRRGCQGFVSPEKCIAVCSAGGQCRGNCGGL